MICDFPQCRPYPKETIKTGEKQAHLKERRKFHQRFARNRQGLPPLLLNLPQLLPVPEDGACRAQRSVPCGVLRRTGYPFQGALVDSPSERSQRRAASAVRTRMNNIEYFSPKLRGARSRLYRRLFLQVNTRWIRIYLKRRLRKGTWGETEK